MRQDGQRPHVNLGFDAGFGEERMQNRLARFIVLSVDGNEAIVERQPMLVVCLLRLCCTDHVGELSQASPISRLDQRQAQRLKMIKAAVLGVAASL